MNAELRNRRILIVDDNKNELSRVSELVTVLGAKWFSASDLKGAIRILEEEEVDCLFADLHLDQELLDGKRPHGIELIQYCRKNHPNILSIAMSSDPRLETYHEASKSGAAAFLAKPIKNADSVLIAYAEGIARRFDTRLDKAIDLPKYLADIRERYPDGIVMSGEARKVLEGIARHPESTLILAGETGTGKEYMAKYVHNCREKQGSSIPFIAVNCATIDPSMANSLLFGHKRGAFTGATDTTNGYIGDADSGILFLDEIQYLDIACQQKLLRVLNDGRYERLGDNKPLRSNFQLITASTRDLQTAVKEGAFLVDLYMRITGGIELNLLPLRERLHEIPSFVGMFLMNQKLEINENSFRRLCKKLQTYKWQGNVRQLFKYLHSWQLTAQCRGVHPSVDFLPYFPGASLEGTAEEYGTIPAQLDPVEKVAVEALVSALRSNQALEPVMDLLESTILKKSLERNTTIGVAADSLQLSRSALDAKRRKYGMGKV